jgi:O-antigen/teichoic acid export membrane protein
MTMEVTNSRVISNSLFIYAGRVINLIFSFFIFVFLANYLGESAFGRLSIAIAYVGTFDIIANFGLNQILVRELSGERTHKSRLLGSGLFVKIMITLVAVLASLAILPLMGYPDETITIVWITSINLLISSKLSSTRTVFESIFQAQLRMAFPILCNLLDNLIFALLVLAFAHFFKVGLLGMAIIYTVCNIPGTVWLIRRFLRTHDVVWRPDWPLVKELLRETLPLAAYLFFSILTTKIDVLMLSWMREEAEVGQYAAATRLVYPLSFLSTSLTISLFPLLSKYYELKSDKFAEIARQGTRYVSIIALLVSGILFFAAGPIIHMLYVSAYAACIPAFRILLLSLGFSFLNFYFIDILISARRQKLVTASMAVTFIVNALLNLLLIPEMGILGAGYAKLASTAVALIMLLAVLHFQLRIRPILNLPRFLFLTAFLVPTLWLLKGLNLIFYLCFSFLIFMALLWFLGIFTYEEKKYFVNLIHYKVKWRIGHKG